MRHEAEAEDVDWNHCRFGFGRIPKLYVKDSATVEQAIIVEAYFQHYCRRHNRYPEFEELEKQFPELYPDQEWYYWPNETWTVATFQYPVTLSLP